MLHGRRGSAAETRLKMRFEAVKDAQLRIGCVIFHQLMAGQLFQFIDLVLNPFQFPSVIPLHVLPLVIHINT